MRKIVAILFGLMLVSYSFAQLRYAEPIFQNADTIKGVEYARADWLNKPITLLSEYNIHEGERSVENRPLYMDIFKPQGDTLTKRPAIIFLHSGAFLLGSRQNEDMVALCDSFARRGYVTATIDYRLGMGALVTRIFGLIVNIQVKRENQLRAVYRGIQDGRAAIRYLKHNAETYGIDTTKIFMVGSSAGGFAALHNIYFDTAEIPPEAKQEPNLGKLDEIGVNGYNATADAVVSFWGAIQGPEIIENSTVPVFLVHGTADDVVPFRKGRPLDSMVPPNPIVGISIPETYGSFCVDTILNNRGVYHETYFVEGKKHEFYGCDTGEFPPEGPNQYWDTIQCKLSDFLLDRFRPNADFEVTTDNQIASFTNLSSGTARIEWEFGDGETSTVQNPVHEYQALGNFLVQLTVYNRNEACGTISKMVTINEPMAVDDLVLDKVRLYPNPVKNRIYVDGVDQYSEVVAFDLFGRKRIVQNLNVNNSIDVSNLSSGIYLIEIYSEDCRVAKKIIKSE